MLNSLKLSLGSNIFGGYALFDALEQVSKAGFKFVEIASIDNVCEHITVKEMDAYILKRVKDELERLNLQICSYSGHVDLTQELGIKDFLKKMEFAKDLGADIINTNAGPKERINEFYKNMKVVIKKAEELNMKVCLESHGDIIGSAQDSLEVIKNINHPLIRLNYDTGNVYFYSRGKVKPHEDIINGLDYIECIHLKDIKSSGRKVDYCSIGDGDIKFDKIFEVLKSYDRDIPITIETPIYLHSLNWEPLEQDKIPLKLGIIYESINRSLSYIKNVSGLLK